MSVSVLGMALVVSCVGKPQTTVKKIDLSALEGAYFSDSLDAIADDTPSDDSVSDDDVRTVLEPEHLNEMAGHHFADIDTDKSGSLSEAEFVARDGRHISGRQLTEQQKQQRADRMKTEFAKFSGADKTMTKEEFKHMLLSHGKKVSAHRRKHGKGVEDKRRQDDSTHVEDIRHSGSDRRGSEVERESESEHGGRTGHQ